MTDTHPWISFRLDLRRLPTRTWIELGECVSKIEHIVDTPLMPAVAEDLRRTYISRGIQGTAAIEGNTLTAEEVQRQLRGELELPPSQDYLRREIDNLASAFEHLYSAVAAPEMPPISEAWIAGYNRVILEGLELDASVEPGEYARIQHGVGRYLAPDPASIRKLMPCFVSWLDRSEEWAAPVGVPPLAMAIVKAVTAHLYLAWIHPFGDGNGRTARLVECDVLARAGVPVACYHLLSDHYNRTRSRYYRRLAESSRSAEGAPEVFIAYAVEGFADGLRAQIEALKSQHRVIVWRDFVHEVLGHSASQRTQRLRWLAIDLAAQPGPSPRSAIRRLSPRLVEAYGSKTEKTVTRDLNELIHQDLVVEQEGAFRAKLEVLHTFMPRRHPAVSAT